MRSSIRTSAFTRDIKAANANPKDSLLNVKYHRSIPRSQGHLSEIAQPGEKRVGGPLQSASSRTASDSKRAERGFRSQGDNPGQGKERAGGQSRAFKSA